MNFNANNTRHSSQKPGHRKQKYVSEQGSTNIYPPIYNPYNQPMPQSAPNVYDGLQNVGSPYPTPIQASGYPQGYPYNQQQPEVTIPPQFMPNSVMTGVAMHYGQALVGSGKQFMDKELKKYAVISRLKYYFAVDTSYVMKKLALLFFPFTHSDWSVKYDQDQPVQPRYAINAPDLYIPTMAFLTYVLVSGLVLGMQERFTPEMLGIQASSALAWMVFEIIVDLIILYVMNIQTNLKTLDLIAFSGYKFVGIIFAILLSIPFQKFGYYVGLIYSSLSLVIFLMRTLKVHVLLSGGTPHNPYSGSNVGYRRGKLYLLYMAGIQPVLMWWLSAHIPAACYVFSPPPLPKT